jgi:transketolase
MRYAFGKQLAEEMRKNKKIYLVVADIGFGVFDTIKEKFPDRLINVGIAEQSGVGFCAGLAMENFIPCMYTITPFLLERPYEAIKLNVVQQKTNVKLVSYGDYPDLGPTHITSDLEGLCKCLGIKLLKPKSVEETVQMTIDMFKHKDPVFMYLSKAK